MDRPLARRWYGGLSAGLLPVLLLGFGYSAIADRLAFVYWALALGAAYTLLLRHGLSAGWGDARLAGALALLLAAGFAAFAALERAHGEILDLGFRALLPAVYRPATTAPVTAFALAAVLATGGGLALLAARAGRARGRA
ncbi:MAG: hypothetical protein QOJ16_1319 [Acidobacteriota bacterium]|jgi:hypothetical protein|nr:hypothetical protein [Acidobacteriota bacterium]